MVNLWRVVNAKGGTEKVFCEMANELVRRGYSVTAIYCDPNTGKPGFHIDESVRIFNAYRPASVPFLRGKLWQKIRCFAFSSKERRKRRRYFDAHWKACLLRQTLKGVDKPDIFISFQASTSHILFDLLERAEPFVTMFHSAPSYFERCGDFDFFKAALNASYALQVLMPEYVEHYKSRLPSAHIVCIPNIAPQYEGHCDYQAKTLINVARLSGEKRPLLLLEAFSRLKDKYPDWKVEWWGETDCHTEETQKVLNRVEELDLRTRFRLCGPTTDVPTRLRASSVFAFPSSFEGQSLALLEAFSMGLPTVACTDCSSVNTMVRNGENGVLTEPTPEAYAEGLARLMESEELRRTLGACAKKDAKAYAPEAVWDAWDSLIREILGKEA